MGVWKAGRLPAGFAVVSSLVCFPGLSESPPTVTQDILVKARRLPLKDEEFALRGGDVAATLDDVPMQDLNFAVYHL